jgi:hypothetical protein
MGIRLIKGVKFEKTPYAPDVPPYTTDTQYPSKHQSNEDPLCA